MYQKTTHSSLRKRTKTTEVKKIEAFCKNISKTFQTKKGTQNLQNYQNHKDLEALIYYSF